MEAVGPERCVRRALESRGDLDLSSPDLLVLAVGKAACGMIRGAFAGAAGNGPMSPAIVLMPEGAPTGVLPPHVRVLRGGHPHPTEDGMAATLRILAEVEAIGPARRLLVLLSGGASALLEAPVEGLSRSDLVQVHRALVASGLPIASVNLVRGCLSTVKNGGLARRAGPALTTTLAISDVEGDDPRTIGSGPTAWSGLSPAEARQQAADLVRRAGLRLPEAAWRLLSDAGSEGSERESGASKSVGKTDYQVIASVVDAVEAACSELAARGYRARRGEVDGRAYLRGSTSSVAPRLLQALDRCADTAPQGLVFGGETTVALPREPAVSGGTGEPVGRGGRNLDLAARLALGIAGRGDLALLAAGTDGRDGSSRAAGAIVDGGTVVRAGGASRLEGALEAFDTEPVLEAAGDLVVTGETGTNVGDLLVAVLSPTAGTA